MFSYCRSATLGVVAFMLGVLTITAGAAPVLLTVDAGNEGLATSTQDPLTQGVIEIGWLDAGTTPAEMVNFINTFDFATARDRFNSVSTVVFSAGSENSFGDGHIVESKTLVADGDAASLAAYKNAPTGAASKQIIVWIRNNPNEASATQQAFVAAPTTFPTAGDDVNFTDYANTVTTESNAISPANVGIGTIANITVGSGMDVNGGSPSDGASLYGGTKVLQTALFASTATIAFSSSTATTGENTGTLVLNVTRSGKVDSAVTVQFATEPASALAGVDYTSTNGILNFAANDTSESIVVPIADRAGFQGDRSFAVVLSNPGGGAELGTPSTAAVTITDDDTPMPGQIVLSAPTYSGNENGGTVIVQVRRVGGSDGAVSVTVATSNGTATGGSDFTAIAGQTVSFEAGDSADKAVSIAIADDTTFEGDETFSIALSNPQGGATLGPPSSATVTIVENDMAPPTGAISFSVGTYSVAENGGVVTITARRTSGSAGPIGATYTTGNGTAVAGTDYTAASGMVIWADNDSADKTFTIAITDNQNDQPDKAFTVTLSNPMGGAALAAPSSATVAIVDNDAAGALAWSVPAVSVNENAGTATLTIDRTGGTDGAVSVVVNSTNGTAQSGTDYTALVNQAVDFAHGQATATLSVPIANNAMFTGNRDFTVTLTSPSNGATVGNPATSTVTIIEDEVASVGTFVFSTNAYVANEPDGLATITVNRINGSDQAIAVDYTAAGGSAAAGSDYTATAGTLTFAQGETQKTFTVAIANDAAFEPNETVNLTLTNPTNGATLGTPSSAVLTIVSEDGPPTFSLATNAYTAAEGETVNVVVLRSGADDQTVSVDYATANGTALTGKGDYKRTRGTLVFAPGETEKTVPVLVRTDGIPENDEVFKFLLTLPAKNGGAVLGTPAKARITIQRNGEADQPDNQVAIRSIGSFSGKDLYNLTGTGQIAAQAVSSGGKADFILRVQNDGNLTDSFRVTAVNSGTANGATVRYLRGSVDVTKKITTDTGIAVNNLPPKAYAEIRVIVSFRGGQKATGYGSTITATSLGTPAQQDVARVLAIIK